MALSPRIPLAVALLSLAFGAVAAPAPTASTSKPAATQCRDKSGKFVACPHPQKAKACRDAKGKFVACPK
ncbi:hypothetical protein QLQ15_12750 [Lysobacter sp. LF1]|uniref:Uncharacterized protein n=1 Tax=Lysobacter stagni TaxID=3045172 RepID=A0ABT6XHZ3_9GAMM|nr:hypothetical protein [Lysobacter sp. LF1]MDI9239774.1 hypothetical protein [Lysobacter sp. LF1]